MSKLTVNIQGLTGTKGGSGVWQRIISEMPEHDVYIEPFWGRGTIARFKRPAAITIGCDVDPVAQKSAFGHALFFFCDGMRWMTDYFQLPPLNTEALPGHTFGGFPFDRHFVYLDPPYLGCDPSYYVVVWSEDDHIRLLQMFKSLPCPAAISGYHSELYDDELSDCRSTEIPTVNRAGTRVTEVVWMNFDPPQRYHDVRFIGVGRRERERIRKRVNNWSKGLGRMPVAERQAIFEACAATYGDTAGDADDNGDT